MKGKHFSLLIFLLTPLLLSAQTGNYKQVINEMANKLAGTISKKGKKTITVTDFSNVEGNLTELGANISNDIEAALLMSDNDFTLVSRDELNRIMAEQEISRSRITEKENVKKIGNISNVDVMIIGEVSGWGEQVSINAKLLDVETANLIGAAGGELTATSTVKAKLEKILTFSNNSKTTNEKKKDLPPPNPIQTASYGNVHFDMISCEQVGQNIVCKFKIVSKGADRNLSIHGSVNSRIFNTSGGELPGNKATIADFSRVNYYVRKDLIGNLPVDASIEFGGLSEGIDFIPKMEVKISVSGVGNHILVFRNVKVD